MYFITTYKNNTSYDGYKFLDGLNIFEGEFIENIDIKYLLTSETKFGFCFYDERTIAESYWKDVLIEITLPDTNPNFHMVKHKNFYRTNMIILGERRMLSNVSTIEYLRNIGANIDDNSDRILSWSVLRDHVEIFKHTVENGGNIMEDFQSLLWDASTRGNLDIFTLLMDSNNTENKIEEIDELFRDTFQHALYKTRHRNSKNREKQDQIKNNYIEILKLLIKNGSDVNKIYEEIDFFDNYEYNYTLLELACTDNNLIMAKFLLDNGADVNANDGCAIYMSSKYGKIDMVKWLLENNANVSHISNTCINLVNGNEIKKILEEYKIN